MNRLVVRQTTAGLMRWLADGATVVIGHDARHRSVDFAEEVTSEVVAAGGRALVLPRPVPTPILAHAVLDQAADAGVMITASHNPAADNGYKLYLGDGIQLVPPADAEIAAEIDRVAASWDPSAHQPVDKVSGTTGSMGPQATGPQATGPQATGPQATRPEASGTRLELGDEVAERHRAAAVAALRTDFRRVEVVYTAMHGVGGRYLVDAFAAAGFPPPHLVQDQFDPDPDFPTVVFPNPEEPGALDEAIATAERISADGRAIDVILAHDPDADRLAVAVPARTGEWTRLSGDEVGVLLADHLLTHSEGPDRVVASSLVSSRLIAAMAQAAGVASIRTLTGFKWVARPMVERPDSQYVFGYEEALGYCVGDRVRDKDGISAALVMAEVVAEARESGETMWDRLDRLARRHGVYLTAPVNLSFPGVHGLARREAVLGSVASDPPAVLAGVAVVDKEDLSEGRHLPPTSGLVWHLADRSRVIIRPSGTEPKLKTYLEVIEPIDGRPLEQARQAASARLATLEEAVSRLLGAH
jgi:phosphomannomutase